jgi:hypothetical protein
MTGNFHSVLNAMKLKELGWQKGDWLVPKKAKFDPHDELYVFHGPCDVQGVFLAHPVIPENAEMINETKKPHRLNFFEWRKMSLKEKAQVMAAKIRGEYKKDDDSYEYVVQEAYPGGL